MKTDPKAIERMAVDHYSAVYRFCARRLGPDLAADAAQETFLTAQHLIRRFDGTSAASTWLFGIALNTCRNLARKTKREFSCEHVWDTGRTGTDESGLIDRSVLRDSLKRLPPIYLEAVLLHEIEGLTYEEAAQVLSVPVGTVKSRLHSAFVQLRQHMAEDKR